MNNVFGRKNVLKILFQSIFKSPYSHLPNSFNIAQKYNRNFYPMVLLYCGFYTTTMMDKQSLTLLQILTILVYLRLKREQSKQLFLIKLPKYNALFAKDFQTGSEHYRNCCVFVADDKRTLTKNIGLQNRPNRGV